MKTILLLLALVALGMGEELKKFDTLTTTAGRTYNKVTVTKIEPDGIRISHDSGSAKIPFEKLTPELQKELGGFDPVTAKHAQEGNDGEQAHPETADTNASLPTGQVDGINEAFGKKLGSVFNPASAIGEGALTNGTRMYQFTPTKSFRSFTKYYVLITPKTHQIYSIWAIGEVTNTETGKKEQDLIMELLTKKYGASEKQGIFDTMRDSKIITHGTRSVSTKISGIIDATLDIRYTDHDLDKIAEKERLSIEGNKVDASGL